MIHNLTSKRREDVVYSVTDNGSVLIIGENNDWGTGYSLPSDQLTHLVVTHDGTTVKLYADGEFVAEANRDYNTDAMMPIMIGTNTDNRNDEYFNGICCLIIIMNKLLHL